MPDCEILNEQKAKWLKLKYDGETTALCIWLRVSNSVVK